MPRLWADKRGDAGSRQGRDEGAASHRDARLLCQIQTGRSHPRHYGIRRETTQGEVQGDRRGILIDRDDGEFAAAGILVGRYHTPPTGLALVPIR